MRLVFLSTHLEFTGGRKQLFDYADYLRQQGHEIEFLVKRSKGRLAERSDYRTVSGFSRTTIPDCDFIIASKPSEVLAAWKSKRGKVVHYCQGFPLDDLKQHLDGDIVPERFDRGGLCNRLDYLLQKWRWRREATHLNRIYSLPLPVVTVSAHLQKRLQQQYKTQVILSKNGVRQDHFYPEAEKEWGAYSQQRPCVIISVGALDISFKGVADTLESIANAKTKGAPIHFIRVAPNKVGGQGLLDSVVDEFYYGLSRQQLGDLYRRCDVFISNSREGEGFGLPAMEALSCGLNCILSDISSYRNFSPREDHCRFVPEFQPEKTAETILDVIAASPQQRQQMSDAAIAVAEDYSYEKACERFEQVLLELYDSGGTHGLASGKEQIHNSVPRG